MATRSMNDHDLQLQTIRLLDQALSRLEQLEINQRKLMSTITDLDNAIAANTAAVQALTAPVAQVVSDIGALLAKLTPSPDYSSEVAALSASTATLGTILSSLQGADQQVNPPADTTATGTGNDTTVATSGN